VDYLSGGGYCYISQGHYFNASDVIGKTQIFGTACSSTGGTCNDCSGGPTPAPPTPAPPTPAPPTPAPPIYGFFRSLGLSNSNSHCGSNYLINATIYTTVNPNSGLAFQYGATLYIDTEGTAFNGLDLWYAISTDNTANTLTGPYQAAQISSMGYVSAVATINDCTGPGEIV
jgi:hypothetical protein